MSADRRDHRLTQPVERPDHSRELLHELLHRGAIQLHEVDQIQARAEHSGMRRSQQHTLISLYLSHHPRHLFHERTVDRVRARLVHSDDRIRPLRFDPHLLASFLGGIGARGAGRTSRSGRVGASPKMRRRYSPVWDAATFATSSGGPSAMILPPPFPPSGPRSSTQSAVFTTSRLCSMTMTVFPWSASLFSTASSFLMSSKCRPVVGSSST